MKASGERGISQGADEGCSTACRGQEEPEVAGNATPPVKISQGGMRLARVLLGRKSSAVGRT